MDKAAPVTFHRNKADSVKMMLLQLSGGIQGKDVRESRLWWQMSQWRCLQRCQGVGEVIQVFNKQFDKKWWNRARFGNLFPNFVINV